MPQGDVRVRAGRIGWHLVLATTVALMVLPVLWGMLASFEPESEIFRPDLFAAGPTLENYRRVLQVWPVGTLVVNTLVMATGVALGQIVIGVLGAYALDHFGRRGRRTVLVLLTVSLAVPPQALIIPQFLLATRFGWLNSDLGLIVPQLGSSAMAVLVLVQHVRAVPTSLIGAARLDGARPREILGSVVLPALRPAIAAVAILVFISTWNEYLWPLLIAPGAADTTVQIGLGRFQTAEGTDHGGLLAAATLTSLPILLVYLVASRRITEAFLTTGAAR